MSDAAPAPAAPAIPRFDGDAAWRKLSRARQAEIGASALEYVAARIALDSAVAAPVGARTPSARALEAAAQCLINGLAVQFDEWVDAADPPGVPSRLGPICDSCGCSEEDACPGGCFWRRENLCSACAEKASP